MDPLSITAALVGFLAFTKEAIAVVNEIHGALDARKVLLSRLRALETSLDSILNRIEHVKEVKAQISAAGAFGRQKSTGKLFDRYDAAVAPGGYFSQVCARLAQLLDTEFKDRFKTKDRIVWVWKREDVQARLDAAIELVSQLRDSLHDDDVALQQATYVEVSQVRRNLEETNTIEILNWISPSAHQPKDAVTSKFSSLLPIADPFVNSDPVYKQWVHDAETSHWQLNCFGKPGSGKSHRARTVAYHLTQECRKDGAPLLFFMFNQANELRQSLRWVYCRLLRQLLVLNPHQPLPDRIRELWDDGRLTNQDGPSEKDARDLLVLELKKHSRKFIVVDALDEAVGCLQSINSALSNLRKDAGASILSTTRLDPTEMHNVTIVCNGCSTKTYDLYWTCELCKPNLSRRFDLCRDCYLSGKRCDGSDHTMKIADKVNIEVLPAPAEIEDFVAKSLKQELDMDDSEGNDDALFGGFAPTLVTIKRNLGPEWDTLPRRISAVAGDSYLVANLIVRRLKAQTNVAGARKVLEGLRSDAETDYVYQYNEQYSQMLDLCLNKGSEENQRVAYKHMALVSCARDPMSFAQLSHAVAVHQNDKTLDDFVDDRYSQQTVRKETNGLLMIGDFGNPLHETVSFFHRTLADFLTEQGDDWFPDREQIMFDACMAYLNLDIFKQPFKKLKEIDAALETYPFASYAACFWGDHLRRVPRSRTRNHIGVLEMLNDQARKIAITQTALHVLQNRISAWDVQKNVGPLHICAYWGLGELCELLIDDGEDVNAVEEGYGQTALHYACRGGWTDVVQLLLSMKANPNVASKNERTPLMEAIENDHIEVAELLLNDPLIDVNADDGGRRKVTALILAAGKGKIEFVKRILAHGDIEVNKCDTLGFSALAWAVCCPSVECVDILLQRPDIDVTIKDPRIGMPLDNIAVYPATHFGWSDQTIAKLFLRKDGQVLGGEALQHLIEDRRDDLVKLFLKERDWLEWKDVHGRSLLHVAAYSSYDLTTLQLVYDDFCRDKDNEDKSRIINARDEFGNTPLHAACSRFDTGAGAHASLLMQLGANARAKNNNNEMPIDVAYQTVPRQVRDVVINVFKPFLGDEVDTINNNPVIALEVIVASADLARLQTALQSEPTPLRSKPDPYMGYTVLHQAMRSHYGPRPAMLELLLPKAMPYLDSVSHVGHTCLHLAAECSSEEGVDLLIKAHANLEIRDRWNETALDIAQRKKNAIRPALLLLAAGAETTIDRVNPDLIHGAVAEGDLDAVRKLVHLGVDIYRRKDRTGLTALRLAKNHHRLAFEAAKNKLVDAEAWRTLPDDADAFERAANDDDVVKVYADIVECLQEAGRVQRRNGLTGTTTKDQPQSQIVDRDLTSLIDRLRDEYDSPYDSSSSSADEGRKWSSSNSHHRRRNPRKSSLASLAPPSYSQALLTPDYFSSNSHNRHSNRNRPRSRSGGLSRSHSRAGSRSGSPSRRSSLHGYRRGSEAHSGGFMALVWAKFHNDEKLALFVVVVGGVVAIAWMWLMLHYLAPVRPA